MLTQTQRQAASDLLWDAWQQGRRIGALPAAIRPATREEGYAVQALLEHRSAYPLCGWKIAATSSAGQRHIGVDGPLAGRLLRERVYQSGVELALGANHMKVAEPEFAFRMGKTLSARASAFALDEVMAAVETLHPAIELPDSRYDDFTAAGAAQLIADNACAHCFVLGPAAGTWWRSQDLAEHLVTAIVTGRRPQQGKGGNVLGDPRLALTWLANELSHLGIDLAAGQVVTTGTCMSPLNIEPTDHVLADFGALGSVELRFAALSPA